MAIKTPETQVKDEIKLVLNQLGIFWYWILNTKHCYPGLPDMVLHHHGKVIYLEIKSLEGKLSEAQLKFQKRCEQDEIPYWVVMSVDGLIRKINGK